MQTVHWICFSVLAGPVIKPVYISSDQVSQIAYDERREYNRIRLATGSTC